MERIPASQRDEFRANLERVPDRRRLWMQRMLAHKRCRPDSTRIRWWCPPDAAQEAVLADAYAAQFARKLRAAQESGARALEIYKANRRST